MSEQKRIRPLGAANHWIGGIAVEDLDLAAKVDSRRILDFNAEMIRSFAEVAPGRSYTDWARLREIASNSRRVTP